MRFGEGLGDGVPHSSLQRVSSVGGLVGERGRKAPAICTGRAVAVLANSGTLGSRRWAVVVNG